MVVAPAVVVVVVVVVPLVVVAQILEKETWGESRVHVDHNELVFLVGIEIKLCLRVCLQTRLFTRRKQSFLHQRTVVKLY